MASEEPVSDLTYSAAIAELERIVADLDGGTIDIDALVSEFQRAIDIIEDLDARIAKAKDQVATLAPRLEKLGQQED